MSEPLEELVQKWEGAGVVMHHDAPTGTWIFIALHNTTLGRAAGGTRMKTYNSPAEALQDAQRLAEAMTYKWAAVGIPRGGGKAVLAVPRPLHGAAREHLLKRYGRLLNALQGGFRTGPDLGTTAEDMQVIARVSEWVHGLRTDGTVVDSGPYTARGALAGIRAAVRHVFGKDELAGRSVLVEGLGAVGAPLARLLATAGARLLMSDLDADRAASLAEELGGELVPPHLAHEVACDVYAPCAVGGVLNAETIPRLRCRVVAGAANNQLADPAEADRLHARGILYAPDYVVNAGGAIVLTLSGTGATEEEILARIDGIGQTLGEIFTEAQRRRESPVKAAERRVRAVLERPPS